MTPPKKTSPSAAGSLFDAEATGEKTLIANIDGGARGNPGPAGYGVYLRDAVGKKVAELSEYLGKQTNNFAEYSALLAALEYAVEHRWPALKVISDSELLVKQIKGEYKVSNEVLKGLYTRARQMIRQLDGFSIEHVLRAQNKDADRLANAAMDRGMGRATGEVVASVPTQVEFEGVVRGGVVEVNGTKLPEGARVKVRVLR